MDQVTISEQRPLSGTELGEIDAYWRAAGEDTPEVTGWTWPQ